ncbi:MAG: acyl-CoA carboxylase subunit epsilon [Catenulispora sp.]|nr:acyl-CoA carboxylase subunit epsilon [Catenulispora sp.]
MTGQSTADAGGAAPATAPRIQVVHGNPTAEELAAVVTVLAAVTVAATQSRSDNDQRHTPGVGGWTARERGVRTPLHSGPGGWRASAFPPAR